MNVKKHSFFVFVMLLCCWIAANFFAKNDASLQEVIQNAEQEQAEAQYNLGLMCFNGDGKPQNKQEAAKWFRKAAEQGYVYAQYNLGVMYDTGDGIPKDNKEAIKWYRKAAEQGDAKAQFNLGVMYASGDGILQDKQEAAKWYHKAAEQGDVDAQYNLERMYFNGDGIPKDTLNPDSADSYLPAKTENGQIGNLSDSGSVMTQMNGENWFILLIISALLTWGIGLAPPLLIRFAFIKHPVSKTHALLLVIFFWAFNIFLFTALGSESKTHGALLLIAGISYAILRKGSAKYEEGQARQREDKKRKAEYQKKKEEEGRSSKEKSRRKKENEQKQQENYNRERKSMKEEEYYRNILGLGRSFTVEDIKRCYRELVAKYHPDKVNHLGEKLKETAEREMKEINEAYEYFKKKYNFK